jgi:hypothetical protein
MDSAQKHQTIAAIVADEFRAIEPGDEMTINAGELYNLLALAVSRCCGEAVTVGGGLVWGAPGGLPPCAPLTTPIITEQMVADYRATPGFGSAIADDMRQRIGQPIPNDEGVIPTEIAHTTNDLDALRWLANHPVPSVAKAAKKRLATLNSCIDKEPQ